VAARALRGRVPWVADVLDGRSSSRQTPGALAAPGGGVDQLDQALESAMARALELARRGPAHGPNPRVGCVLVGPDGESLGEGWHRGAGTPHAEVAALDDARGRGASVRGATAVVTLEPCDHTGRTGPCSRALLDAGVSRVVIAVADPNPVAAGGAARLRAAGVDVVAGVAEEEGRAVLGPWLHAIEHGRPFVTLKLATSLDGRVAAADGSSRWITSQASRRDAHALRAQVDAIAVGSGTAVTDDPALTARDEAGGLADHQPLRVVVGHRQAPADGRLRGPGGELVHAATHDPHEVLALLHAREVRHLLVEGGPTIAAAFLRAGLVDEVRAYVAPVLLGAGRPAVDDLGIGSIDGALRLEPHEIRRLGPDVLIVGRPRPHDPPSGTAQTIHLIRTPSEES